MLIEHGEFDRDNRPPLNQLDDTIFRSCSFANLEIEGSGLDGALIYCTLRDIDWYWGLFNTAIFLCTRFENCTFRGASFMSCRLLECQFIGCHFALDNLGGPCTFEDCSVVECTFDKCKLILDSPKGRTVFERTRWYGCTQNDCIGFSGLF